MKNERVEKLLDNLHDKTEYVMNMLFTYGLKSMPLKHGLMFKRINFNQNNQKAWLKPHIDMNTQLRRKTKNDFEKDFF